jgi:hypothetical protein
MGVDEEGAGAGMRLHLLQIDRKDLREIQAFPREADRLYGRPQYLASQDSIR